MPTATNHNRKKAARNMERWRHRRREVAMRRLVALGAEFVKERLSAPSWLLELFHPMPKKIAIGGSVLTVESIRRTDDGAYEVGGVLNKPIDFITMTLGFDPAAGPDETVSLIERRSPTGRSGWAHGRLSSGLPNFDNIRKTPREPILEGADYSSFEARCVAAALQRNEDSPEEP